MCTNEELCIPVITTYTKQYLHLQVELKNRFQTQLNIHPSIHPSIFFRLSRAGSRGQLSEQGHPDFPHPGHFLQLFWEDPKAFPGQLGDIVTLACPGSSPGSPPCGTCQEHLPRKASHLGQYRTISTYRKNRNLYNVLIKTQFNRQVTDTGTIEHWAFKHQNFLFNPHGGVGAPINPRFTSESKKKNIYSYKYSGLHSPPQTSVPVTGGTYQLPPAEGLLASLLNP